MIDKVTVTRKVWVPERMSNLSASGTVYATRRGGSTTNIDEALTFDDESACAQWCDRSPSVWVPAVHEQVTVVKAS